MADRVEGQVPARLLRRPFRVLRPQDASDTYAHPRAEIARLVGAGGLPRLATGYNAVTPPDRIGRPWLPELEAAAFGIAVADYGSSRVALMGLSAARMLGAFPRALGVAIVAVPKQRPVLKLVDRGAVIIFVRRDVERLELQRAPSELGDGWVTSPEQTLLDLAARPDLGGLPDAAAEARDALLTGADRTLLIEIATAQRRKATALRLLEADNRAQS